MIHDQLRMAPAPYLLLMQNTTAQNKTFSEWISEAQIETELRSHVKNLHKKSKGGRYGIDSRDLFHDVFVKLERHNHLIPSKGKLFSLVSKTALNHLIDISKKHSFRSAFYTKPMPTRLRPLPGSSMKTVASKAPNPATQAAISDEVARIRQIAAADPKLKAVFDAFEELSEKGEPVSTASVADQLDLTSKQAARSMDKLRSVAKTVM